MNMYSRSPVRAPNPGPAQETWRWWGQAMDDVSASHKVKTGTWWFQQLFFPAIPAEVLNKSGVLGMEMDELQTKMWIYEEVRRKIPALPTGLNMFDVLHFILIIYFFLRKLKFLQPVDHSSGISYWMCYCFIVNIFLLVLLTWHLKWISTHNSSYVQWHRGKSLDNKAQRAKTATEIQQWLESTPAK